MNYETLTLVLHFVPRLLILVCLYLIIRNWLNMRATLLRNWFVRLLFSTVKNSYFSYKS